MKAKYFIAVLLLLSTVCLSYYLSSTPGAHKPVMFADEKDNVFFKAEMSPTPPEDSRFDVGMQYWCRSGIYNNRQFVGSGIDPENLLKIAFQVGGGRFISETILPDTIYWVEVIVPEPNDKMVIDVLRQTIVAGLNVTAQFEERESEVLILKPLTDKSLVFKESDGRSVRWRPSKSEVDGLGLTMGMLSSILSNSLDIFVFEDTGISGRYDITFEWEEGNINNLIEVLNEYGLTLYKDIRTIEKLVVRSIGET